MLDLRCIPIATIYEIAKMLNTSPATVSRALSGNGYVRYDLKNRIIQVAKEINYQPNSLARSLITKQSFTLGLILPDITNPFFPALARGVEDVAHRNGYNLILCNTDDNAKKEADYLQMLRGKQIDGVIFTTSQVRTKHVGEFIQEGIPIVLADRRLHIDCDLVVTDNIEGAYQGTMHLIGLGHSSIAIITGPRVLTTSSERLEGYNRAFRDSNLPVRTELISEGDYRQNSAYLETKRLMKQKNPPTAIFACNDLMAIGVLAALEEEGIAVPNEVAVAGYDDTPLASAVRPRLTTIVQPKYEMGAISCELLINRIRNKDKSFQKVVLKPNLVIRESSIVKESRVSC